MLVLFWPSLYHSSFWLSKIEMQMLLLLFLSIDKCVIDFWFNWIYGLNSACERHWCTYYNRLSFSLAHMIANVIVFFSHAHALWVCPFVSASSFPFALTLSLSWIRCARSAYSVLLLLSVTWNESFPDPFITIKRITSRKQYTLVRFVLPFA